MCLIIRWDSNPGTVSIAKETNHVLDCAWSYGGIRTQEIDKSCRSDLTINVSPIRLVLDTIPDRTKARII